MKFFTNKSIWSKIIIVLIFVLVFEFIVAKPTLAEDEGVNTGIEFAGKLMSPILSLVVTLGDAAMEVAQSSIMGTDESLLEADLSAPWYDILGTIFTGAIVVGLFLFAPVATTVAVIANALIGAAVGVDIIGTIGEKLYDTTMATIGVHSVQTASYVEENLPETLYLPSYSLTPEEIFKGNILMFNADFFGEPKTITPHMVDITDSDGNVTGQQADYYYYTDDNGNQVKTSKQDMGAQLSGVISQWYVSIRNIALVAMMIVLLYIGIRMMLSTLSSDKAKYRQMLQDWLVGLIILFLMHYIMAFSVTLVQKLTDIVSTSIDSNRFMVYIPNDKDNKLRDFIKEAGMEEYIVDSSGNANPDASGEEAYIMYPTDMMGYLRLRLQLSNWGSEYVGLSICFVILVMFTIFFVFTYFRRVLYMAFLTLIAPVVAVTYPIDKINDGSAQGFSKWFREYIFNLLVQPMHLLLYYILISSAFELASENVIYSIVAIGFMIPAEKLLRSLFGFEKSSTASTLNGVAGGALAMAGINKLSRIGHGGGKTSSSSESSASSNAEEGTEGRIPRMNGKVDTEARLIAMAGIDQKDGKKEQENSQGEEGTSSNIEYVQAPKESTDQQEGINQGESTNVAVKNQDEPENITIKEPTNSSRKLRRITGAAGAVLSNKFDRSRKREEIHKAFKEAALKAPGKAIRYAKKAALGTATASIGLAAGVATGDPSSALSNAAAGAAIGATIVGNSNGNGPSEETRRVWNQAYNSREFEDEQRKEYIEKFKKQNRGTLERNFDKNQVDKMLENGGSVEKFIEAGVNNIDDIVTGETMILDPSVKEVKDVKDAIAVAKFAKEVDGNYKGPEGDKWKESTSKRLRRNNKNLSEAEADKVTDLSMQLAKKYDDTKKGIYK